jgi:hypothetical protein
MNARNCQGKRATTWTASAVHALGVRNTKVRSPITLTNTGELAMTTCKHTIAFCVLAISTTLGMSLPTRADDRHPLPAGSIAFHYVGRITVNVVTGTSVVYGYLTHVEGVPGPYFNGPPSEVSALFTFKADAIPPGPQLPSNGDVVPNELPPGNFAIYYTATPSHDWGNPDSFASGQRIATFRRSIAMSWMFGPGAAETHSAALVASADFTINDQTFNFEDLVGHGVTDTAIGTNTPTPGSAFPIFSFPFAGWSVVVPGRQ